MTAVSSARTHVDAGRPAHTPRPQEPLGEPVQDAAQRPAGEKQVAGAAPPAPEQAMENIRADVAEIKESAHR
ncbi:hypothetical protein [Streptomyces sp. NPDC049040]|uniref:hypothetical protein n=1 Tax=Streptomyces sp. NPDC049040 TaxID=3365593 RepID=UPI0037190683